MGDNSTVEDGVEVVEQSASKKLVKTAKKVAPVAEVQETEVEGAVDVEVTKVKAKAKKVSAAEVDTSGAESLEAKDLIAEIAIEVETLKGDKAFKMVNDLQDAVGLDSFKLGGVLAAINSNGWYMDKGYDSFKAYVEAEAGMMYRKSMYLVNIYTALVNSGVKWELVKGLGWTKIRELASFLTQDNVAEWVGIAENMTTIQLQDYIKGQSLGKSKDATGDLEAEAKKTTSMTFKLHEDQKETVRDALDKCKHEIGTEADAVALEHICMDFISAAPTIKALSLTELMKTKSAIEVLEIFGQVFPEVSISAEIEEA